MPPRRANPNPNNNNITPEMQQMMTAQTQLMQMMTTFIQNHNNNNNSPNNNKVCFVAIPGSQKVGHNTVKLDKEALEQLSYNQITNSLAIPATGTNVE